MTSGGIYLVTSDGLIELNESPYESEVRFQELLVDYPKLLAGEQMDAAAPRRWLLVKREAAVPDSLSGGGRWALDHLFLDQEGVPTLVEVKRSSDTRLRREVVGQMLDYAANAVAYWPIEKLIGEFEATCSASGLDPDDAITGLVDDVMDVEEYWQVVKTNLQAGRIRMIFVADVVPVELRRIVEFLNEQLDPAEVYAVEIRRFANEDMTALVPRLVGAQTPRVKGPPTRAWSRADFLERIEELEGLNARRMAESILTWVQNRDLLALWGRGLTGSMKVKMRHHDMVYNMFNVYADGRLELPLGSLKAPYDDPALRSKLLKDVSEATGLEIPADGADKFPQRPTHPLYSPQTLTSFLSVWDAFIESIRAQAGSTQEPTHDEP